MANIITITETEDGFDATITMADGSFTETIESLYDVDSCLAWARMHLAYQTNKYVRR